MPIKNKEYDNELDEEDKFSRQAKHFKARKLYFVSPTASTI